MNCRVQDNLLEWNSILIIHINGFRVAQATSPTFKVHLIGDCHSIHYATATGKRMCLQGFFCKRYEHIRRYTILNEIEASLHGWDQSNVKLFIGYAGSGNLFNACCITRGVGYQKLLDENTPRRCQGTAAHLLAGIGVWRWLEITRAFAKGDQRSQMNKIAAKNCFSCTKEL